MNSISKPVSGPVEIVSFCVFVCDFVCVTCFSLYMCTCVYSPEVVLKVFSSIVVYHILFLIFERFKILLKFIFLYKDALPTCISVHSMCA